MNTDTDSQASNHSSTQNSSRSSWYLTLLFLGLGLSGFLIERCAREDPRNVVTVDTAEIDRLSELWESQAQRPPTDNELEGLVREFVREEILVREASRLGLEQDDIIIRRRLAQKMSFLLDDTSEPDPPTRDELEAYFNANAERFAEPRRTSFQHIYSAEQMTESRTTGLLDELGSGGAWRALGDPFMLRREYAERTDLEIDELFGQGFSQKLLALDTNAWQPPIQSALGWHLVRISKRQESTPVNFDQVRSRVSDLYIDQQRRAANRSAYDAVAAQYRIEMPDGFPASNTEAQP